QWEEYGMVFSKSDDDSCILYDLILRQYITLLDDPKMLSLAENINQIATYKEFVMGNVLTLGLHLVSGLVDPVNDDKFSTKLQILLSNVENNAIKDFHSNLINNEDLHIKAIKLLSKKQFVEAIDIWKKIIEKNPKDLLAVKLCHDVCFYMCNMDKMINIYILVTKYLDRNHPLYSYILAMFAFAKIELFCYHEAESLARESLILNPLNAWGTHSLIHVYTMQANIDDGINFLVNTHSDWKQTQFLACHLYWHMGLLYLEKNDVDTAFEIFQRQLKVRVKESLALFHLTDAQWEEYGMVFSKSDDDSCILYDLILRQYITLLDDPKMLSLAENINQIATYKEFVMGNVLTLGLHLVSGLVDPVNDDKFSTKLQILLSNVENNAIKDFHSNLINNEDLHIKAIKLLSKKQFVEAIDIWKKIIEKNPKDLLAVKLCHDVCFYMCNMDKMINIYILVTKYLDRNHPLYSYILAMFAFAKIELFCYHEAESLARESLILNPLNAWGTHSLIHVYTMQANIDDGINFLVNTHSDWKQTQFLACHLYWHMGLLYLEKNDVDTAFEIFQRQLKVRVKESLALFHLTDAVSLLYRINHTANINT
ncbi:unnamed protein product, partial [Gordionus sp. m RMFG-2023]